jgi:hypothetical protein
MLTDPNADTAVLHLYGDIYIYIYVCYCFGRHHLLGLVKKNKNKVSNLFFTKPNGSCLLGRPYLV